MKKTEDLKFGDPCEVRDSNDEKWTKAIFGCDFSKVEGFTDNYIYSVTRNGQIQIFKQCRPIQEPKEFWVNVYEFGMTSPHESKKSANEFAASDREELLRLIEYSAFEKLQQENEKLQKEMEELKGCKG